MKSLHLFIILVFAVSLSLAAKKRGKFGKYCEDLSRRECRSRGRRCKDFMEKVANAMQPEDMFTHCAEKSDIPVEKREEFMKAVAIAFWHGDDSQVKNMTPSEQEKVSKFQNCTFTLDGLINQDGKPNMDVYRARLAEAIRERVKTPSPQFREVMIQALNSCGPESLENDMKDCLIPPCIKSLGVEEVGKASPDS